MLGCHRVPPCKYDWKFLLPLKHFLCLLSQRVRANRLYWQDVLCDDLVCMPSTSAAVGNNWPARHPHAPGWAKKTVFRLDNFVTVSPIKACIMSKFSQFYREKRYKTRISVSLNILCQICSNRHNKIFDRHRMHAV